MDGGIKVVLNKEDEECVSESEPEKEGKGGDELQEYKGA